MGLYTVYATKTDLAEYLGVSESSLPENSERLLKRASELVKQTTRNNIDNYNMDHLEAAKLATCAQVEYWISLGDDTLSIIGGLKNFNVGSEVSMDFGEKSDIQMCSRASGYLNQLGLLNRGVKTSHRHIQRV